MSQKVKENVFINNDRGEYMNRWESQQKNQN